MPPRCIPGALKIPNFFVVGDFWTYSPEVRRDLMPLGKKGCFPDTLYFAPKIHTISIDLACINRYVLDLLLDLLAQSTVRLHFLEGTGPNIFLLTRSTVRFDIFRVAKIRVQVGIRVNKNFSEPCSAHFHNITYRHYIHNIHTLHYI